MSGMCLIEEKSLMAEHYTKNTLECTAWCARCQRMTQHRVDGGRQGPCIDPAHPKPKATKAQERRQRKAEKDRQNPRLFG